ncbi:MAG: energy transducer TonB [Candidatus Rokubacteria bacterium]|nr:energy transducer TonB [Candidatus Rokubacteria bacterium]
MSRWRVGLPASLLVHGGGLLLLALVLAESGSPPVLFIDLAEGIAARDAGAASGAQARPARTSRSAAPAREEPLSPPELATAPAPPPPAGADHEVDAADAGPRVEGATAGTAGPVRTRDAEEGSGHAAWIGTGAGGARGGAGENPVAASTGGADVRGAGDAQGLALAVPPALPSPAAAEYGPYLGLVRRRIQESLRYPLGARRRSLTGTVHLEIVIRPTGAIEHVRIIDSSSHPILDEAAVDTVRSLPPLPFPAELSPRTLRVRLPVVFELR